MLMELIDETCELCEHYLAPPAVSTVVPSWELIPKPWGEILAAFLFFILVLSIKSYHRRRKLHRQLALSPPPTVAVSHCKSRKRGCGLYE